MEGARKLKIALDETRMLVLGAQVLLGFQLRGPFEKAFETLDRPSKDAHVASLMLMILVIGLLIAPSVHLRIIDDDHIMLGIHRSVSRVMETALVLFAASLALSMYIVFSAIIGSGSGLAVAVLTALTALFFWFGLALLARKVSPVSESVHERISLAQSIDQMLIEARVILPGAQALLGFQLAVVMTEAFASLHAVPKIVHGIALLCIALSTVLLMAPAAYHRIVYDGDASRDFLRIGSRFLLAATGTLALGVAADAHVVISKLTDSDAVGFGAALASFVTLVLLWHVSPIVMRAARKNRHASSVGQRDG